ncbi:MAG: (d)CMP kinase [Clostridia bacterium]|nr:(d)CMP kinase [Clostridia bacterium]
MQIAIDGPAGAGKSTISKFIAQEMGYLYIDTGAMYRAIGYKALKENIDLDDNQKVDEMAKSSDIELKITDHGQSIFLDGADVTSHIRTPEVSMAASKVSAIGGVRRTLVDLQRKIAGINNVIMDGRDIGTVVLPDAEIKIFLTASAEDRAMRRYLELKEKGMEVNYQAVLEDMETRDYNDSHRAESPLKAADDATVIDTSGQTLGESVQTIVEFIKSRVEA